VVAIYTLRLRKHASYKLHITTLSVLFLLATIHLISLCVIGSKGLDTSVAAYIIVYTPPSNPRFQAYFLNPPDEGTIALYSFFKANFVVEKYVAFLSIPPSL
jgi:hypothetical protein